MTAFTKENLERIRNAIIYTGATISPHSRIKSKEKSYFVLVHGGRVHQSYAYLKEAEEIIKKMLKEVEC
jgi:hypothetical protein